MQDLLPGTWLSGNGWFFLPSFTGWFEGFQLPDDAATKFVFEKVAFQKNRFPLDMYSTQQEL